MAERTYVFLRRRRTLILIDRLQARIPGEWQGHLHLDHGLQVRREGRRVVASSPDHPGLAMQIVSTFEGSERLEMVEGRENPPQGWTAIEYGKLAPSPTLIYHRSGPRNLIGTVIAWREADSEPLLDLRLSTETHAAVVSWREGDQAFEVTVQFAPELRVAHHCR